MDKNELMFFAVIIILYVICAFTIDIPPFIHYVFLAIILIVLLIAILLKYQQKFENKKIYKISNILAAVFLASYVTCTICETYYHTELIDSAILLIPFFGALVVGWFFKKE